MSFIETVLEGKNEKERKNKAFCAVAIVITAILLVISIIAFTIYQVVGLVSGDSIIDYKIELTESKKLSSSAIHSGTLLLLDDDHDYAADDDDGFLCLETYKDRPKLKDNNQKNAYTVYKQNTKYKASADTTLYLNKMLGDFYATIGDDNIIVKNAYNSDKKASQSSLYASGTAVDLEYFVTPNTDLSVIAPITGISKYEWIYENAYKYGFIALYEDSEPTNVFRYIGVEFATGMKINNLSFDELIEKLKNATSDNPLFLNSTKDKAAYYCSIDDVRIPVNYYSETSGDNVDGIYVLVDFTKEPKK